MSVDGKSYLGEIVFSAFVGIYLLEKYLTFGRKKKNKDTWRAKSRSEPGEPQESGFPPEISLNQAREICWSIFVMEALITC